MHWFNSIHGLKLNNQFVFNQYIKAISIRNLKFFVSYRNSNLLFD